MCSVSFILAPEPEPEPAQRPAAGLQPAEVSNLLKC